MCWWTCHLNLIISGGSCRREKASLGSASWEGACGFSFVGKGSHCFIALWSFNLLAGSTACKVKARCQYKVNPRPTSITLWHSLGVAKSVSETVLGLKIQSMCCCSHPCVGGLAGWSSSELLSQCHRRNLHVPFLDSGHSCSAKTFVLWRAWKSCANLVQNSSWITSSVAQSTGSQSSVIQQPSKATLETKLPFVVFWAVFVRLFLLIPTWSHGLHSIHVLNRQISSSL